MIYMREPTVREARQMLTEWAAKQASVSLERDTVIRLAFGAGLPKMEIHRLTGVSRPTIDRITSGLAAPSEAGSGTPAEGSCAADVQRGSL
jgi:hypothetical protein